MIQCSYGLGVEAAEELGEQTGVKAPCACWSHKLVKTGTPRMLTSLPASMLSSLYQYLRFLLENYPP